MTQPLCAYEGCGRVQDSTAHSYQDYMPESVINHPFQPQSIVESAPTSPQGAGERKRCEINSQSSMQYVGMKLHSGDATLQEVLEWMVDGGSSVSLSFGEDTGLWECSWITWGERFTGVHKLVRMAVLEAINKAFARAVELGPPKESR